MSALPASVFTADKLHVRTRWRHWKLSELSGRTVELSSESACALVSVALNLVRCAQADCRQAVWITLTSGIFYPPDAAETGIDLDSLVIVRTVRAHDAFRAASRLGRSGGFDLIAVDLTDAVPPPILPLPLHDRLIRIADKHNTAFLFLAKKAEGSSSIAPSISLRGHVTLTRLLSGSSVNPANLNQTRPGRTNLIQANPEPQYECTMHFTRDRKGLPGWRHSEVYRAPSGMR